MNKKQIELLEKYNYSVIPEIGFIKDNSLIDGNISDDEYDKYGVSHPVLCCKYLEHYVIADYVAFYIASGYYHSSLV